MNLVYCENCGPVDRSVTHVIERDETLEIKGEPITTLTPIRICNACDEEIYDKELDGPSLSHAFDIYRMKHRLIMPAEIRALRERYGLSQRNLAALIGLGEITIHRYENGSLPDEAQNQLLRFIGDVRNMRRLFEDRKEHLSPAAARKLDTRLAELEAEERMANAGCSPLQPAFGVIWNSPEAANLCQRLSSEVSEAIRQSLSERNMSITDLGSAAGLNPVRAEGLITGNPDISLRDIASAAAVLGAHTSKTRK